MPPTKNTRIIHCNDTPFIDANTASTKSDRCRNNIIEGLFLIVVFDTMWAPKTTARVTVVGSKWRWQRQHVSTDDGDHEMCVDQRGFKYDNSDAGPCKCIHEHVVPVGDVDLVPAITRRARWRVRLVCILLAGLDDEEPFAHYRRRARVWTEELFVNVTVVFNWSAKSGSPVWRKGGWKSWPDKKM